MQQRTILAYALLAASLTAAAASAADTSRTVNPRLAPQRQALGTQGNARYHNLVTTPAGEVLAWGYNSNDVLGQGGPIPGANNWLNRPACVRNVDGSACLSSILAASVGELDAMALTETGNVLAWAGGHDLARAKRAGKLPSLVRNAADDASLGNIVQVEVGQGNAVALSADGKVWTWGSWPGHSGNNAAYPNHPQFAGGAPLGPVVQVAAGGNFSLALGADGKVYGWGWNHSGETGRGSQGKPELMVAAVRVAADDSELENIVAISAGYNFALALAADGRVYAWGDSSYGQTAQGVRSADFPRAVPVKDSSGAGLLGNIAMVAAGGNHAYALDKNGRLWSWGLNNTHALGEGSNGGVSEALLPRAVVGVDSTGQLDGIVSVAAGYEHGLALRSDGSVLAWGAGFAGNLGQGNDTWRSRAVPTPVLHGGAPLLLQPLSAYPNLLRRGR